MYKKVKLGDQGIGSVDYRSAHCLESLMNILDHASMHAFNEFCIPILANRQSTLPSTTSYIANSKHRCMP